MNESRCWPDGDDAPPELRELLSFAEAPRPLDEAARARSRARTLALAAFPAAAGTLFWVKNLAFGALLGGVVSVGVAVGTGALPLGAPSRPAATHPSALPAAVHPAHPARPPEVVEPPAEDPKRLVTPKPSAPTAEPAGTGDGVAGEVRLLEAARRALGAEPARALALLERHEREFPAGVLTVEREFLAIDALVRSGRRDEAVARGRRLRERMPGSLYEERLERILGKGE